MTQDTQTTLLAALAGLLHDIGKFAGRAEIGGTRTWDQEAQAEYRYKHALLSADFVNRYVPQAWRPTVLSGAGYHHRPQTSADRLVTLADRLAAAERRKDTLVQDDEEDADDTPRSRHPKQLEPIFRRLITDEGSTAPGNLYLPLKPLQLSRDAVFPHQALDDRDTWRAYEAMWQDFTQAADALRAAHTPDGNLAVYLESLLLLMQQYTWCIPSAYFNATPDISLYNHSRMTAALAAVLARRQLPDSDAKVQSWLRHGIPDDRPLALLIGGDLSGVQQFIYTITARGATPALRGRSFYLQMLTEVVVRYLLDQLGLPMTNVIYAGGGNFYLLAAPEDAAQLPAWRAAISRILLDHHQGDLYLALAARPLSAADLQGERLGQAWGALHQEFHTLKQRRFSELGHDLGDLFAVPATGGNSDHLCAVCGQEHPDAKPDEKARDAEGESPRKCPPCFSYEQLGDELRRARYLQLSQVSPATGRPTQPGGYGEVLAAFGYQIAPFERVDELQPPDARQTVWALDDDALAALKPLPNRAIGRKLLVNTTPLITQQEIDDLHANRFGEQQPVADRVKPFSVLAHQSRGIKRLGVLRLDVDNLGHIFSHGLGQRASLSRIASLSFAVSLYFEGWVAQLAAQQTSGATSAERLYSIYSGGDDLFFVGAWDAVVELAAAIRRDLSAYVAGHPGIHASAGIALVTPKYPLYQAAADAGEAERAAKSLVWYSDGQARKKDAICFLGQALPWRQFGCEAEANFLSAAMPLAYFLAADDAKRQPLIRRLSGLHAQYAAAEEKRRQTGRDRAPDGKPQPLFGPWMYRAAYALARLAERDKGDKSNIESLRHHLEADQFQSMPWIGLAARWADLLTRGEGG